MAQLIQGNKREAKGSPGRGDTTSQPISDSKECNPYLSPSLEAEAFLETPLRNETCFHSLCRVLESTDKSTEKITEKIGRFLDTMLSFSLFDIIDARDMAIESLASSGDDKKGGIPSLAARIKSTILSLFTTKKDKEDLCEASDNEETYKFIHKACSLYLEMYYKDFGVDTVTTQCFIPSPEEPFNKFSSGESLRYLRHRLDARYGQPRILTDQEKAALIKFTKSDKIVHLYEEACRKMKNYLLANLTDSFCGGGTKE
jgi:hypothetical protein